MEYASEGDLHKYLQKNFTNIAWNNKKLFILQQILTGLEYIHNNEFIHRDFHSGNILLDFKWKIGDLGLSQSVNNESSNDEIYGVIPYIAPEIFKGSAFSKEADIYCLAIYTSRPLSALISKCLSTNSSSTISFVNNQDYNYISKENELDIDIESLSSQNLTVQNPSASLKK
ncbi:unnamed protein product [Rhizophagus irregularis]|uniref:Protein kinase domain-containing protein n=1 Tax=Rhizophagus irregularis TaxID=588596 RepID=A0A915Z384_9GLOM|nr:unnamed protein product [Rhizophagus irregularis]CAB5359104.1 unnamed protein product [Rhizophagus irregularis]